MLQVHFSARARLPLRKLLAQACPRRIRTTASLPCQSFAIPSNDQCIRWFSDANVSKRLSFEEIDALLNNIDGTDDGKPLTPLAQATKEKRSKIHQRYSKTPRDGVTKTRKQLRYGKRLKSVLATLFADNFFDDDFVDTTLLDVVDVDISQDGKTAVVAWTFCDGIFPEDMTDDQHTIFDEMVELVGERLSEGHSRLHWAVTRALNRRSAPLLRFKKDESLAFESESLKLIDKVEILENERKERIRSQP